MMLMPRQRVVMPQEVLGGPNRKNTVEMNHERTNKIGVYLYIYTCIHQQGWKKSILEKRRLLTSNPTKNIFGRKLYFCPIFSHLAWWWFIPGPLNGGLWVFGAWTCIGVRNLTKFKMGPTTTWVFQVASMSPMMWRLGAGHGREASFNFSTEARDP